MTEFLSPCLKTPSSAHAAFPARQHTWTRPHGARVLPTAPNAHRLSGPTAHAQMESHSMSLLGGAQGTHPSAF